MHLKKLPVVQESGPAKKAGVSPRAVVRAIGCVLTIPSLLLLLVFAFFTYPHPAQVTQKQVYKKFDGRFLPYNSTPITTGEWTVLRMQPEDFDYIRPIEAYFYLDTLGDNPMFGFNFQENYQNLKDAYVFRVGAASVLLGIGLFFLIVAFFLPPAPIMTDGPGGLGWED